MRQLFLALFMLAGFAARAQPTAWTLALPISNPNGVMDVATGPDGAMYVTGRFTGALQMGTTQITSAGPGVCLYIAKCQPDGQVVRVTKLEGATDVVPRSIAVDAAGNSYVTGHFLGTLTYDDGRQTTAPDPPLGGPNSFLVKCGPNGRVRWVSQADGGQGGPLGSSCTGTDVAVDQMGNSYVTGQVRGPNIRFGLLAFGPRRSQGFVASYDRRGQLRWAQVFSALPGGGFTTSGGGGLAVDNAGSCYVSGNSIGGWTLGSITLLSPHATNYLARFETGQGQLQWAISTPGSGDGQAIATDRLGDVYVGGSFEGTAVFGPNSTLTSAGEADGFVARYDPNGDVDWATALGGPTYDVVNALAVDQKSRKIFASGFLNFTSQGTNQSFLARLSATGQVRQTERVGGVGTSSSGGLAIDDRNNIYTTGVFTGTCHFGQIVLNSAVTQSYLGRYGSRIAGPADHDDALAISTFPNPAQDQFTLRFSPSAPDQPVRATLYNQLGRAVAQHALRPGVVAAEAIFDTAALPDGLYTLRLEANQQVSTRLLMVQH